MTRRRKTWVCLAMLIAMLAAAPTVEALLVSFKCESGTERVEGQNFCFECAYTICCALFDDGSTQCTTTYHCLECEPRVK